jgi:pimeloyl-ACP methyl ester carboxylesterase
MHGGWRWITLTFRPRLDALGEQIQLIYYDHRGNGRSQRPASLAGVGSARSFWGVRDGTISVIALRISKAIGGTGAPPAAFTCMWLRILGISCAQPLGAFICVSTKFRTTLQF